MFEVVSMMVLLAGGFGAIWWVERHQLNIAVKEWCRVRGLIYQSHELLSHELLAPPHRQGRNGPWQPGRVRLVYMRGSTGEIESGNANWINGRIVFDRVVLPDSPKAVGSNSPNREMSANNANQGHDPGDDKVSAEVARRLDSITQTPGWIEAYDLDGSGHIDSEEWDMLRDRVIAEVRAELEVSGAERNRAHVPIAPEIRDEGWW